MSWYRPHKKAHAVGGRLLCTRQQAALLLDVHPDTVKRRYYPNACDVETRLPLFDPEEPLPKNNAGVLLA